MRTIAWLVLLYAAAVLGPVYLSLYLTNRRMQR